MRRRMSDRRRRGLTPALAPAFALLLWLAGARASAQDDASGPRGGGFAPVAAAGGGFGGAGQIAISGELEGHLRSGWEIRLHPALDYFIVTNVSVGGAVGLQYTSGSPGTTVIDLGARAGYNLNINGKVGIWPRVGLNYQHVSRHPDSSSAVQFRLDAPILYHLVPHLFVGAGPFFTKDLNGGGTGWGLDSIVGGWF
jgi:hypothetical protein